MKKLSKKEILIILVLAILAAGLSWFWLLITGGCVPENGNVICYERSDNRGFPIPYWNQFDGLNLVNLFIDFLIYFVLFYLGWAVLKFIVKIR